MARRLLVLTLALLLTLSHTSAQSCANVGDCSQINQVSQCTKDVYSCCLARCNNLAQCFNLATNCYDNYAAIQCYQNSTRSQCCEFCAYSVKTYLGPNCLYGDKDTAVCTGTSACNNQQYAAQCCETCFTGSPQTLPAVTTAPPTTPTTTTTVTVPVTTAATTTPNSNICIDRSSTCQTQVSTVPSTCYQADLRAQCCASCQAFSFLRGQQGYNIVQCPYGDRAGFCLSNPAALTCSDQFISFTCCDTCVANSRTTARPTTAAPCVDVDAATCSLPKRFCYAAVSPNYRSLCCASCALAEQPSLGASCLYGDRDAQCSSLVTPGQPCDDLLKSLCCGTCQLAALTTTTLPTTTVDPCQNNLTACDALVGGQASNCYTLNDLCCKTCRPYRQLTRPLSCLYGNRIPQCTTDLCGTLESSCCATCADAKTTTTSTVAPTTTTAPCFDLATNCTSKYQLLSNPGRCYLDVINAQCCASCQRIANALKPTCPFGDKDQICSASVVNCAINGDLCCSSCAASTLTPITTRAPLTTQATATPPSACVDSLTTCDALTSPPSSCYSENSQFVSSSCCRTCFFKRRPNALPNCTWGDRVNFCNLINNITCLTDSAVRRDCCESCYNLLSTTTTTTTTTPAVTTCPDVFSPDTCRKLLAALGGNCTSIQSKCCNTCTVTTTTSTTTTTTTPATTTNSCVDQLGLVACLDIIDGEGIDQCYTDFMSVQCCATCQLFVTTTATPTTSTPSQCTQNLLPNCNVLFNLTASLCDPQGVFRVPCCKFCADRSTTVTTSSPPTTAGTTQSITIRPDCGSDKLTLTNCALAVFAAGSDPFVACTTNPFLVDNCCLYCRNLLNQLSSTILPTTAQPVTTTTSCTRDLFNCTAIAQFSPDLCTPSSSFRQACCNYCASRATTTTQPITTTAAPITTVTLPSFCTNKVNASICALIAATNGGATQACTRNDMLDSCCLYCITQGQLTTTLAPPTQRPCNSSAPQLVCSGLITLIPDLCMATSNFYDSCCVFCTSIATTTTSVVTTTAIVSNFTTATPSNSTVNGTSCVDIASPASCLAIYTTNQCNTTFSNQNCCNFCKTYITTAPTTTTTAKPTTTVPCVDILNCPPLLAADSTTCNPSNQLSGYCCATCRAVTTTMATTQGSTLPPVICNGDIFLTSACNEFVGAAPYRCVNDTIIRAACCRTCGFATGQTQSVTTAAPTSPMATTTTTAPGPCLDLFGTATCQARIASISGTCSDSKWTTVCCASCRNAAGQPVIEFTMQRPADAAPEPPTAAPPKTASALFRKRRSGGQ